MINVQILHNSCKGIMTQVEGVYNDCIRFHTDNNNVIENPDYVITLNSPQGNANCYLAKERLWLFIAEPIDENFLCYYRKRNEYHSLFTAYPEAKKFHKNIILDVPMLPMWTDMSIPDINATEKNKNLSWVTSNKSFMQGHQKRLSFLENIRKSNVDFDLFGQGFQKIDTKSIALKDYKYSIAFENFVADRWFTEKIGDIFAYEAMPIYFGCPNILDYFPEKSMYIIDPEDKFVFEKINEVIHSDMYLENRNAILEAKQIVLGKYDLRTRLANYVLDDYDGQDLPRKKITIKDVDNPIPTKWQAFCKNQKRKIRSLAKKG